MWRGRWLCFVLTLLLVLPLFVACGGAARQSKLYFDLFDTVIEVICYREDPDFDAVCARIYQTLKAYHELCDIYTAPREGVVSLYTVNASAGVAPVQVDARLLTLLQFCVAQQASMGNAVQVTYGAVLSLWHTARETGVLPDAEALADARTHTDPNDLVLDAEAGTVFLRDPAMRLDVGAIAKGYAVERVAEMLVDEGVDGYLINAGGNVRAIGPKQAGTPWRVDVTAPSGASALGRVEIMEGAIVTSGAYYRFLEVDGKTYSHIIDPTTGMPAERYASVTISVAQNDLADLLSTALFVLPEQEGRRVAEQYDAQVLWVYADGSTTETDDFSFKR